VVNILLFVNHIIVEQTKEPVISEVERFRKALDSRGFRVSRQMECFFGRTMRGTKV